MVISHHSDKRTLGQAFLNNQHARRFLVRILIAFSIIQPIGDCFGYSSQIWINFDKSQYSECHSVMKQTYLCQPASLELVTLDQGSINLEILNICRPPVSPSDRVKRVNVLVTVSQQPRVVPAPLLLHRPTGARETREICPLRQLYQPLLTTMLDRHHRFLCPWHDWIDLIMW